MLCQCAHRTTTARHSRPHLNNSPYDCGDEDIVPTLLDIVATHYIRLEGSDSYSDSDGLTSVQIQAFPSRIRDPRNLNAFRVIAHKV